MVEHSLDDATRKQLERGQRVTELMKQAQYAPLNIAEMAVSLYAANEGYLDEVELNKIGAFESALHAYMNQTHAELMSKVNDSGDWSDEFQQGFKEALEDFIANHSW